MAYARDLPALRLLIASNKRWDLFFALCGLFALMVGVLTFVEIGRAHV